MEDKRKMPSKPLATKPPQRKKPSPKTLPPVWKETATRPSLQEIVQGGTKEEAVRRLMAEMSSSEEDASRRKSRDSDLLVKKILEDEKRALAAGSSGESSMSSVDTRPRKTAHKNSIRRGPHTKRVEDLRRDGERCLRFPTGCRRICGAAQPL
ncbi:hypothetical protein EVAR_91652_1 [Eumeta japonica]|uniref:Uncharacterized protein n=1 Tax=Eumeta variegata TaxID=151549 RepID=A0A4C1Z797_EUMVA|nr:hypothetical protein EVAR_91652_1 [Eumeta japonica]